MGTDALNIAQISTQLTQIRVQQSAQVGLQKIAINQQAESAQQLLQMLSTASIPDPQGRGRILDILA